MGSCNHFSLTTFGMLKCPFVIEHILRTGWRGFVKSDTSASGTYFGSRLPICPFPCFHSWQKQLRTSGKVQVIQTKFWNIFHKPGLQKFVLHLYHRILHGCRVLWLGIASDVAFIRKLGHHVTHHLDDGTTQHWQTKQNLKTNYTLTFRDQVPSLKSHHMLWSGESSERSPWYWTPWTSRRPGCSGWSVEQPPIEQFPPCPGSKNAKEKTKLQNQQSTNILMIEKRSCQRSALLMAEESATLWCHVVT